ncbi:hypothetical protein [Arenibaculum pallidiluteum]|uniref:hypothetical protein n=1 Tax=Arenibaculum pallidiluteum TaxID=2812559 RepID=UPI001A96C6E5|nr:hypothetical protein [Arenibaculum pallidiluteum]
MRAVLPLAAVLALSACAMGPQAVESSAPTVTYRFERGQLDQTTARADEYCAQYGQRASIVDTTRDGDNYQATFECQSSRRGTLGGLFGG